MNKQNIKQLPRRQFIKKTCVVGAGLSVSALTAAQMMKHGGGHMGQEGRGGMGKIGHTGGLLPASQLQVGQPLNSLWKLPNSSNKAGLFKAKLVAKPTSVELIKGVKTDFWTYNDKVPGPLIELYEGQEMEIEFENNLPYATTVHWHGMTLPANEDGAPMDPVPAGAKRTYNFTPPEGSAGTYWFHPHPHGMTAEQVFRGLAGAVIVRAKNDPLAQLPEKHLIFSDLKLDASGQIVGNNMMDWMNGREGQFALVNGQQQPVINVNESQRWRLWNMNSARYLRLSLAGTPLTVVGTDGGLLGEPRIMSEILLTPGERIELIVDPAVLVKAGKSVELSAELYDRGKMMHGGVTPRTVLAYVNVGENTKTAYQVPQKLRSIKALGCPVNTRRLVLTEVMDMRRMHEGFDAHGKLQGMDFLINGKLFDMNRIDIEMPRDTVEIWEIYNDSDMDHPMHIHGTQFQVVDRQLGRGAWVEEPFLAWRDTVNVRPQETVRLKMVQTMPGDWMYHCHILEHEDLGMMGMLRVK